MGAWFFQVKADEHGEWKLLEIGARIAGTMALHRVQGINFALLSLYEHHQLPYEILLNPGHYRIDRCLLNLYEHDFVYDTVYVDLDDTIFFRGQFNLNLIKFLYQCLNEKKKIVLISKSLEKDRVSYLKKLRISEIFDEIIWLDESESKADHIRENSAIFIDDSFSQRKEVHLKTGIPTFDSSMLEVLMIDKT